MIRHQIALIKREIWEHRSLYITPAVVGLVLVLAVMTAFVFASGYQEIVDIGIVGAQNMAGDAQRRARAAGDLQDEPGHRDQVELVADQRDALGQPRERGQVVVEGEGWLEPQRLRQGALVVEQ